MFSNLSIQEVRHPLVKYIRSVEYPALTKHWQKDFTLIINLRPLQPVGIINVNRLPIRIRVQRRYPRLPMAVPRLLRPAEPQMRLRANRHARFILAVPLGLDYALRRMQSPGFAALN